MNRNYSFATHKADQENNHKAAFTEERIQQIMKKYERPFHKRENTTKEYKEYTPIKNYTQEEYKEYTPIKNYTQDNEKLYGNSEHRYRQRTEKHERVLTPLRQTNTNVNRYEACKEESYKIKGGHTETYLQQYEENTRHAQKHRPTQKYVPQKYTPQRYSQKLFEENTTNNHLHSTKTYEDEHLCVSPYRQTNSSYQHHKHNYTQNPHDFTYRRDVQTPTKQNSIRTGFKVRETVSKQKQLSITLQKSFDQVDCNGRISNIDKINDKIKKILQSCSGVKNEVLPMRQKYDLQPKQINKSYDRTPTKTNKYGGIGDRINLKLDLSFIEGKSSHQKTKTSDMENFKEQKIVRQERSRSCLYTEEDNKYKKNNEDRFNKIQEQINSFNNKIAHHNEQKKKLNLELTPTNKTPTRSTYIKKDPSKHTFRADKSLAPSGSVSMLSGDHCKSKNKLPEIQIVESHRSQRSSSGQREIIFPQHLPTPKKFKEREIIVDEEPDLTPVEPKEIIESQFYSGIQDYSNFSHNSVPPNIESKKLIKLLSEQVKLDEEFRFTKTWFSNSDIHNQFEVLQSILSERWRQMSIQQIEQQFSVNFQEDDPFYSYRAEHYVLEDLVNNYIICNKNWKQKILNQWNINDLKAECLIDKLDMDGKGYIQLQDLVRVINMEEGTFYRNRDLYIIFQRMMKRSGSNEQKISTKVFLSMLSSK